MKMDMEYMEELGKPTNDAKSFLEMMGCLVTKARLRPHDFFTEKEYERFREVLEQDMQVDHGSYRTR